MVHTMVKATTLVLDTWEKKIQDVGGSSKLEINNDMGIITSSVISHTTFGNNYKEGQQSLNIWKPLFTFSLKLLQIPFFLYLDIGYFSLSLSF